jgi:hypothetical protein
MPAFNRDSIFALRIAPGEWQDPVATRSRFCTEARAKILPL